ncbi:hypothetical protein, partial [Acetobacter musti]|uniref:hypothetical protein n=1 Tax=Acetobacter musti TaxID=864732 RepID=UPI001A7E4E3E
GFQGDVAVQDSNHSHVELPFSRQESLVRGIGRYKRKQWGKTQKTVVRTLKYQKSGRRGKGIAGTAGSLPWFLRSEAVVVGRNPQAFGRDGTVKPQAASAPLPPRGVAPAA